MISKTFLVTRGGGLEAVRHFLSQTIKDVSQFIDLKLAPSSNETVLVTLVYHEAPPEVVRNGYAGWNNWARVQFNKTTNWQFQSGSFDDVALASSRFTGHFPDIIEVCLTGLNYTGEGPHRLQVGPASLSYSAPVPSGPLANSVQSRRGVVTISELILPRGASKDEALSSVLNILAADQFITLATVLTTDEKLHVFFVYFSKLEPELDFSYPVNGTILTSNPPVSSWYFKEQLNPTGVWNFYLQEEFNTPVAVESSRIALASDSMALHVTLTGAWTSESGAHYMWLETGKIGLDGQVLTKSIPLQYWVDPGCCSDFYSHAADQDVHHYLNDLMDTFALTGHDHSELHVLSGDLAAHVGDSSIHFTTGNLLPMFSLTGHDHDSSYAAIDHAHDYSDTYTTTGDFGAHTGNAAVHFFTGGITENVSISEGMTLTFLSGICIGYS